ncbi:SnoaL-like polyketide cyclase [Alsobacter soli]|uniref:SnoaL-like polyketide cyclase n=1 Tax=Alsobacter soli TaxID=2109933 RepID=A0A2T1HMW7_9HYPH|nr:SnoaL-like polyketide cyclase [Alsobacter soli]
MSTPSPRADLDARTPEQVLDEHLRLSRTGTLDEDLVRNFSPDLVVLTGDGVHRGHAGMRDLAARLRRELPGMEFTYKATVVSGHMAFLEWSTTARNGARVDDGTDSYWIEGGRIVAQTIHYTVIPPQS